MQQTPGFRYRFWSGSNYRSNQHVTTSPILASHINGSNGGPCEEVKRCGKKKLMGLAHQESHFVLSYKDFINLPDRELLHQQQKGLCYRCGGVFHSHHQCLDRQLRAMVLDDDDEDEGEAQVLTANQTDATKLDGECSVMHLGSLNPEKGWKPNTIKLKGFVRGVPILILVNSGATHNFISSKLVTAMGIQIEDTCPMRIKMGDGHKVITTGACKGVELKLGALQFSIDALLFALEGIDVVLGMSWLTSLG